MRGRSEVLEALAGIEPAVEDLQSSALPLGDSATSRAERCLASALAPVNAVERAPRSGTSRLDHRDIIVTRHALPCVASRAKPTGTGMRLSPALTNARTRSTSDVISDGSVYTITNEPGSPFCR